MNESPRKRAKVIKAEEKPPANLPPIFENCRILLIEKEVGKVQAGILKKNVLNRGNSAKILHELVL